MIDVLENMNYLVFVVRIILTQLSLFRNSWSTISPLVYLSFVYADNRRYIVRAE